VLDPFGGAGTTGLVADRLGRNAVLLELNPEYAGIAERRIRADAGMFIDLRTTPLASHATL
jgi:DNA modification methylase